MTYLCMSHSEVNKYAATYGGHKEHGTALHTFGLNLLESQGYHLVTAARAYVVEELLLYFHKDD